MPAPLTDDALDGRLSPLYPEPVLFVNVCRCPSRSSADASLCEFDFELIKIFDQLRITQFIGSSYPVPMQFICNSHAIVHDS